MSPNSHRFFARNGAGKRAALALIILEAAFGGAFPERCGAESPSDPEWRPLPLIANGKVDSGWLHVGWGGFVVDDEALRTECDPKGLGLLVYKAERFGNCQIRVVFKTKEAKSNSGVYVRIADGILDQAGQPGAAFERDEAGKISEDSMAKMKVSAEREEGPWFAVHRGYEVQIAGGGDPLHRTGAIYSLAPAFFPSRQPQQTWVMDRGILTPPWRTMIITLAGHGIFVDLDEDHVTSFDSASPTLPPRKQWHEPKREPQRLEVGYIGLQNHDPGDIVWFKEVSVRPLPSAVRPHKTGLWQAILQGF